MATRPLTIQFQQTLATIGEHAGRQLAHAYQSLPHYNEEQIPEFTARATPFLTAAKTVAVRHAVAYYAMTAGIEPLAVPVTAVTAEANLREPFISTWQALKAGHTFLDAVTAGIERTDAVARNLVVSAARQTGDQVVDLAGVRVVGWERVPDGDACPWCLEVAPGFYTTAETADFGHDRCGCTAEPILVAAN